MSANKTQNFGLHVWEAGDDFLRSEFNENFAAIDRIMPEVVMGRFAGLAEYNDPAIQPIELGFQPKAVLVVPDDGDFSENSFRAGALFAPGLDAVGEHNKGQWSGHVTETGFEVRNITYLYLNMTGKYYFFLALK